MHVIPNSAMCLEIFYKAIHDYHIRDNVDAEITLPAFETATEALLYTKCWVDTVQWHLEDIIRLPDISPVEALEIKRRIDISNQKRTDLVEQLDESIHKLLKHIQPQKDAPVNTESPAWAIDRLSILCLKVFHMSEETRRSDAPENHRKKCLEKLRILQQQQGYLTRAIDELLNEIANGKRITFTYNQMKMYNDDTLNPVLYKSRP